MMISRLYMKALIY